MRRGRLAATLACFWLAAPVGACGSSGPGTVIVFAAASLTESFEELAEAFEEQSPGTTVLLSFAASQRLAAQITQGAPADVFASASLDQMDVVVGAGLAAGEPQVFAENRLEIAVEPGNPLRIRGLADLTRPGVVLVLGAPDVPAGRYAHEAFEAAGLSPRPASEEPDVKSVVAKVALGEADAGVVYHSDVVAAGGSIDGIAVPADHNVVAVYPIVTLANSADPERARAFLAFVRSPAGQAILERHGFSLP